ncbi:MAG: hypothetical protein HZB99_00400 [Candidatus Harrisonbacteria bacterium]|nr:hypothetical protein [Candidatus Harrisonbacteria bacterium]
MKKKMVMVIGLFLFCSSNIFAKELDDLNNLNKLVHKSTVTVWVSAIGNGGALLQGTVLNVYTSSMTMKVRVAGENYVSIVDNPFFLAVLGDNLIGSIEVNNESVVVSFQKNGVLAASAPRNKLLRALIPWFLPRDKYVYVRSDILEKVRKKKDNDK